MMEKVPSLGLGTAALALTDLSEAERTLSLALDSGIKYFDTAALYGGGQAEIRLGKVLKSQAARDVFVSTKVGRYRELGVAAPGPNDTPDVWDFSEATTRASIRRSQDRLGRDYLDCVFLHDIEMAPEAALAEALPVLKDLQAKGEIGLIGAGCNTNAGLIAAIYRGAADVVLVAGRWTLLDRSAARNLLPLCARKRTAVVAGGVLNSGLLAKRPVEGASFDYRPATVVERDAATRIHDLAQASGIQLINAALSFPTRHSAVDTLLLGVSTACQLEQSLSALKTNIPQEFWENVAPLGLLA
ncbi:aldo/keto reductase [Lentilitoribacter sp. EG35]|uniref:aldo/keto reductase n=1 Tax=Lentilitoribacter sp. EG35 TaxID=3234192 RepID=UPI00345FDC95